MNNMNFSNELSINEMQGIQGGKITCSGQGVVASIAYGAGLLSMVSGPAALIFGPTAVIIGAFSLAQSIAC